jgi:16S rRNA processing protein RimM
VAVGYCSKAHGIRGELTLTLEAESPDVLRHGLYLRPRRGGPARFFRLRGLRRHHGNLLLALEGVETRNDAETLRAHTVLVDEQSLPALADDEVYLKDLPGLNVFVRTDNADTPLGRLAEISSPAGQDLWTIKTPDGREILFPAVDEFIVSLDTEQGRAVIAPPPGLLELYANETENES